MGNACTSDSNVADENTSVKPAAANKPAAKVETAAVTPKQVPAKMTVAIEPPANESNNAAGSSGGMLSLPMEGGPGRKRNRRVSVSAEVDNYHRESNVFKARIVPKSDDARKNIKEAMSKCFLFNGMDAEQEKKIVDAMEEKKVAPGDEVISQFADGDFFYVIQSGFYEVHKSNGTKENPGEFKRVFQYDQKGSFGELALMYNCPRAATVKAATDGVLWAVDRATFRNIIIKETAKKREMHETFLRKVPVLANLSATHISQIADSLQVKSYNDGEVVIKQGEPGEAFFLVESGDLVCKQTPEGASDAVEVGNLSSGDYFGERALLTNEPRAADVVSSGASKVVSMDRATFERLFTKENESVGEMMKKIKSYPTANDILAQKS
mmetsp:Transcript_20670/g.29064  ORF Transcript_20670/g.29064 Transcript_20670/m.29064 type:complete len:382 (-) Transcript_20670:117-1262(-)|eukprot:CAMPEP_0175092492 /NCGR_PEP_ID=MMETSP0086_2-20121207/2491_1 /TAXON_ID=136419 /ORGANISM="Unknown Unknown, Strain D1" /LENGTH=381 /DNA_ID=CAMNT_0016365357 /DNA_START=76 /DNA_END=1221 /DNA_ORIENTATION=+